MKSQGLPCKIRRLVAPHLPFAGRDDIPSEENRLCSWPSGESRSSPAIFRGRGAFTERRSAFPSRASFENDWVEFSLGPILAEADAAPPRRSFVPEPGGGVFSTESLDATLATLKEKGVTVTRPPADEFTGRSAEILDPDGYRIILFQPSDLHPDEEWVPTSRVDELVRHRLAARRQREKARLGRKSRPARRRRRRRRGRSKKRAKKKTAPKKRPAPEEEGARPVRKAAKKKTGKKR